MTEAVNEVVGRGVDYLFHASAEDFKKIPGSPIVYWVGKKVRALYEQNPSSGSISKAVVGLQTGDNDQFMRFWYEVTFNCIEFHFSSTQETKKGTFKWVPYNKGGSYRKWYGNMEFIVNWENDGFEIRNFKDAKGKLRSRPQNTEFYFKEAITWSEITSSFKSFRLKEMGSISDVKGQSVYFNNNSDLKQAVCWLNTKIVEFLTKLQNPTLSFQSGDYKNLPYLCLEDKGMIEKNYLKALDVAKNDWNTYETSWDFTENPLIKIHIQNPAENLSKNYQTWSILNAKTITEMQRLEEENNRLFIDAYGLQDELTPEVPLKEITLTVNPKYRYGGNASDEDLSKRFQSDTVCELISYAIGCMMGRYSLKQPGLVYAHAGNEGFEDLVSQDVYGAFLADDDGIIPLTDQEWFADDVTNRLEAFIKTVWGAEQLNENLAFIAESLGLYAVTPKNSESPLETIRRYLSQKFYKDHLKTYKKRPIYWLFSSGKQKAFECLVYLHRYNECTLARMRTEYVILLIGKYDRHANQLQTQIEQAESTAQANKFKKELAALGKKQHELTAFGEQLKDFADMRITLDLDDGVKVNYGKFGGLLVDVKGVAGKK